MFAEDHTMRKQIRRLFAFLVAIMLAAGSINVNLLTTYAAGVIEREYTYTFAQLTDKGGWGNSHAVDSATGALTVTFSSQYAEVKYALPDALAGKKVLKVTLNGVVGDNSQFNLKQYSTNWDENYAAGGSNVITVKDEVNAIGFGGFGIQGKSGDVTVSAESVTFTVEEEDSTTDPLPVEGTYTITVYPSALTCDWHNTTTAELNAEKRFNIAFSDASYNEARLVLPENLKINMPDCESITINVNEQDGPVNFCAWNGQNKVMNFYYNTGQTSYVLTNNEYTGEFDGVGVQIGSDTTTKCVLDSIVFTMNKKTAEDTDVVYGEVPGASTPVEGNYTVTVYPSALNCEWYNTTVAELNEQKRFHIGFSSAAYNEAKLVLPDNLKINMPDCESITVNVNEQDGPVNFNTWDGQNKVMNFWYKTGQTSYVLTDAEYTGEFDAFGVQIGADTTTKIVLDSIVFTMNKKTTADTDVVYGEAPTDTIEETYTITYPAEELVLKSSQAGSCELVNGNYQISFSAADQNVNFKLPATVNLEKCKNIIVTVASQTGPMNFNVGLDNSKLKDYWYNIDNTTYTLVPGISSKINEFGIQCGRENDAFVEGAAIELVSVSFLMNGTAPLEPPADDNYSMAYFEVADKTEGVTSVVDEQGVATITFPNAGDRIVFAIPDSVDINHLVSMDFHKTAVSSGADEAEILIEVLTAGSVRVASTLADHVDTNCNPEVSLIALTSNTANTVLTLAGIQFNIDPAAFEAIVLNGNFARTDISMWGAALWGSVDNVDTAITLKTSSVPIFDDINTYGELNRRSSPYVCFAQNVSDRVEANHGYAFSFWAKLSDDYIGAPTDQRMIEFSPYYFDANGNENYNMTRTGSYRQVLEPGVWTYFSGVVGLPAGAQGMVIRIVEQGTNYGQGDCVLGGYSVTGVKLEPSSYPSAPSGNGGGSKTPVITKTATCEVSYEFENLSIDWATGSAKKSDTFQKISFVNKYDEVRLKLPRTLDMSTCAYIYTNVTGQNVPIAVKLYYKGKQVDVSYYNSINSSYLMVPEYTGMIDAVGIMSLADPNPADAYVQTDSIRFGLTQEPAPEKVSDSIVINGDFADEDLSDWGEALWGDGVTITRNVSDKAIADNIKTYATYSKRTSPYQCFAQDITGRVMQNSTYKVSFWAKLSDDYKDAPADQRVVQFAPYTVDIDGNPDYNPKLSGNLAIALKPGEWTYFEGTYKVTNSNPISKVVIRILEQGTNYGQGECVMGSFSIADVRMEKYIPVPPEIDEDVPNLKDALTATFGEDFIAGTALTLDGLDDPGNELLINKHFNAITLGNELKPDALFGYSNNKHTELKTAIVNGKSIQVPTLNFSRADELLNGILRWNESHPDTPFKIRGHVLVWHSQTPEWFFREDYTVAQRADGSENYVTPEVMNLRLEWYIKSVLEHYTGAKSPYKDLFYGWDVVNEAVSDSGNGYRTEKTSVLEPLSQSTHSSNSSWWAVYHSNEFIINAFRFANQYAPADLELYYNDYNECDSRKVKGIVELLKAVKEAEGTRIDGMGMQAHYRTNSPKIADIESAIRAYAAVVGQVQLTELDLKASQDITYKAAQADEYQKQAKYYHDIYLLLQRLNTEDDITIGGITFWGVTDSGSWLQTGSAVGGGSDGLLPQCPLLFDAFYRVKPAFWAFVDYTKVDPDWSQEAVDEKPASDTNSTDKDPKDDPSAESETSDTDKPSEDAKTDTSADVSSDAVQKSSPVLPIVIAVCAVLAAGGSGTALFLKKRKKK